MKASSFAKKAVAVLTVLALIVLMPLAVFADPDNILGSENENIGKAGAGNVVNIPKGISFRYDASGQVYFYPPDITYHYTIAPAAPPTGTANGGVAVMPGPADSASITGQPTFTSAERQLHNTGDEVIKYITVTIDPTKFTKPGIYRYIITDETPISDLYNAGIVRKGDTPSLSYVPTRYLDVYVNSASDDSTLEVGSYVLTTTNETTYDTAGKSIGYLDADNNGFDSYRNYATMLKKVVSGSMGDRTHDFPFTVTIDNDGKPYHYIKYTIEGAGRGTRVNATDSHWVFVGENSVPELTSITLKHNEALVVRGLYAHANFYYTETNDTAETYKVAVDYIKDGTGGGETDENYVAETVVAPTGTLSYGSASAPILVSDYETYNSTTSVSYSAVPQKGRIVQFTNKINAISPTGIILRFIPFVVLAGFAGLLLVLAGKTKRKETKVRKI